MVVARLDGTRIRGFVYDVSTERGEFHLYASEEPGETRAELVRIADCKGVFFVKSLAGNPGYRENKTELTERRRWGRPFEVVFHDGERMVGTVEIFHPGRLGFYIVPPDPRSNNLRIFVVAANARSVRPMDEASGPGVDGTWEVPDPANYPLERRCDLVLRLLRDPDAEKLSLEAYLPVQALEHWKRTFLASARASLTDEALAEARRREDPDRAPEKPDRTPPEKRLDIVVRLFAREDQAVLSQVFLVPFRLLAEWRERFLEAGKAGLRRLADEEAALAPDALQSRYEDLLVAADSEDRQRDSFLDSLSDAFK